MAIVCLVRMAAERFNIVGVVPPHHSEPTHEYMVSIAQNLGLNVMTFEKSINDKALADKIRFLDPDIAIVCSYSKKFSKNLLESVRGGFINIHPSLLPEYRGANAYSTVLINQEKETGITLHFMDENFDTGNIIWQKKVPIEKNETMGTLFNKTNYLAADMVVEFFKQYEINSDIKSFPQPEGEFKTADTINDQNMKNVIDWSKDAVYLESFIRALNPFIHAVTIFRGVFMRIHSASVLNKKTREKPGTIVSAKDTIDVATGDGILQIRSMQFGSYMITDSKSFIEIFNPQVGKGGERLGNG